MDLSQYFQEEPKDKVFGQDIPGTLGTQTSGYPGQELYASGLFVSFSAGSGRDVPGFGSRRPGFGTSLCKKTLGWLFVPNTWALLYPSSCGQEIRVFVRYGLIPTD